MARAQSAFNAEVMQFFQWDDHEVTNNWFPGGVIDDRGPRSQQYTVKSHDLLAANAKRAFLEYLPLRLDSQDPERIYRAFNYGPSLDVFMLDERSYRGPNSPNRQEAPSTATAFLGMPQLRWLKRALLALNATWKVVASDMPLGLLVPDVNGFETWANGDGPALGPELELASLLAFIKANDIANIERQTTPARDCAPATRHALSGFRPCLGPDSRGDCRGPEGL
jgi:alkaline phosphatase D